MFSSLTRGERATHVRLVPAAEHQLRARHQVTSALYHPVARCCTPVRIVFFVPVLSYPFPSCLSPSSSSPLSPLSSSSPFPFGSR